MFQRLKHAFWKLTTSKREQEASLEWVTGVLPLITFKNLFFTKGSLAVEVLQEENLELAKYIRPNQLDACFIMTQLVKYLKKHDPDGQSKAYKLLEKYDPGFKMIETLAALCHKASWIKFCNITKPAEWKDPEYLYNWILANAVPRLAQVPESIAEEAHQVVLFTDYWEYYIMFFWYDQSLRKISKKRKINDLCR
ncbi:uncharacterized protein FTOL_03120 [Fusarium torulosum]|uniref:Uncharacterized protein n=1 Tax=Fusarium torulosum TaxID=33205 RepID=A0AAE8M3D7_9HYPO|nr:uncharacterized protein FTOL_03120 [Fusarium torulosum]